MKEQPEALWLADAMSLSFPGNLGIDKAAAELRRLHAEVERLSWDSVHTCHAECQRPLCKLTRERDALLEALKEVVAFTGAHGGPYAKARAAIKAVEGENHAKNL